MANFSKNEFYSPQTFTHEYNEIELQSLAGKANELLTKEGYKLVEGQPGNATYERGDRTMRILFGAFVKYSKIQVTIGKGTSSAARLTVDRKTSGMSGGLIGMNQVKKEMERISQLMATI